MGWRRRVSIVPRPTMPRLDRERVALARLATATDDAALAEWARLRLRATDFVAAHAMPTPAAIDAAAARDRAAEPLDTSPPSPLSHVAGATLVDVTEKLPTLDRLAAMNAARHEEEADTRRTEDALRRWRGTPWALAEIRAIDADRSRRESLAMLRAFIQAGLLAFAIGAAVLVAAALGADLTRRHRSDGLASVLFFILLFAVVASPACIVWWRRSRQRRRIARRLAAHWSAAQLDETPQSSAVHVWNE